MSGTVASSNVRAGRLRRSLVEFVAGPRFARRLVVAHAVDDFADAFVNLSLVGSLFLSVSLGASRSRVLLYLVWTVTPLVLVAPAVGRMLDRTRFGYRWAISGSQLLRAAVSVALIGSLLTLALYPLAFLILLSRKVYALARAALLSHMADDPHELLRSDAQLARSGTVAGGVGTAIAGVLLARGHVEVMLGIAAVCFVVAAVISMTLPSPKPPERVPRARLRDTIPSRVWSATLAVTAVRAAGGALTYLLAFAIKRGGGDTWIFAAGLLAAGTGGLVANLSASRIHRRLSVEWILVLVLIGPGLVCALGVVTIGNFGVLAIAFAIGLGRGVGTRAVTMLNATVPRLARARSIARSELMFQVASVVGAILAVQFAPGPNVGFALCSVVMIATAIVFAFRQRDVLRVDASRLLLGEHAPRVDRGLPEALLYEAKRLAALGAYRMAVVIADSAIDVLVGREPDMTGDPTYARWSELGEQVKLVRSSDQQPDEELVLNVLELAESLIEPADANSARTARRSPDLV